MLKASPSPLLVLVFGSGAFYFFTPFKFSFVVRQGFTSLFLLFFPYFIHWPQNAVFGVIKGD